MQIWETKGLQLIAAGNHAPSGDEIIAVECSYGGAGTCQSGTVRPVNTTAEGRDAEWMLSLAGTAVFRGIPDAISDGDGQLAQVALLAPHKPRLGALGAALGGVQAGPYETLSAALDRELGGLPRADIGITPDGYEVAAEPGAATVYQLDDRAYDIKYVGPTYPDAVTDAVFTPGEGFRNYKYTRPCPPYALRRAGQATANPAVINKFDDTIIAVRREDAIPSVQNGTVTMSFNNLLVADGVVRRYEEVDSTTTQMLTDVGIYEFTLPADTDERKVIACLIHCPFFIEQIGPRYSPAPVTSTPVNPGGGAFVAVDATDAEVKNKINTLAEAHDSLLARVDDNWARGITPRATRKPNELTLTVHLDWNGQRLSSKPVNLAEAKAGLELSLDFKLDGDLKAGGQVSLRYELVEQDTGKFIILALRPIKISLEYRTPNLAGVQMPDGWDKPFRTEPRWEFRLPGWHIPPLLITGLPGGRSQMVASASVTWNRNDCSTLITTEALGYG